MLDYTCNISKNLMLDLLDLAQLENNSFRLKHDTFSVLDIINKAFIVVSHAAAKKKVTLVPPKLETYDALFFTKIEGDEGRFQQILVNLLSNSIKFSRLDSEIRVNLEILEITLPRNAFDSRLDISVEQENFQYSRSGDDRVVMIGGDQSYLENDQSPRLLKFILQV